MDANFVVGSLLTVLGTAQGLFIFFKGRSDRRERDAQANITKLDNERRGTLMRRVSDLESQFTDHSKDDREMADRVQKSETKIENLQVQINEANARHGDLVRKLDDIRGVMLTKEDFKMLIGLIRNTQNG